MALIAIAIATTLLFSLAKSENQKVSISVADKISEGCELAAEYYLKADDQKHTFKSGLNESQKNYMMVCSVAVKTILATIDKYPCQYLRDKSVCLPDTLIKTSYLLPFVTKEIELLSKTEQLTIKYQMTNLITDSVFNSLPKAFPCAK